jgi:hypothetical protein
VRLGRWMSTVVLGLAVAGIVAAVVAEATAAWLFLRYRPTADGVAPALLDPAARPTSTWTDIHGGALAALVVFVVLVLLLAPAAVAEEGRGVVRPVGVGLIALVGVVGAAVGAITTRLVLWDQVALEAVTVGSSFRGWKMAAFDDGVRFVLVDGVEVSPGSYAIALVAHLAAPAGALAALLVMAVIVARRRLALAVAVSTG